MRRGPTRKRTQVLSKDKLFIPDCAARYKPVIFSAFKFYFYKLSRENNIFHLFQYRP